MQDAYKVSGSSPTGEGYARSGSSPPTSKQSPAARKPRHPDFVLQPEGNIFLLIPLTDNAANWCDHFLVDVLHFGSAVVIEHRYAFGVVQGILEDGMIVNCTEGAA